MEKLVKYMVGREMKERFPEGNRHPGEIILEVNNLHADDPRRSGHKILNGVNFDLRRGEILGIAGLMGSGRTELVTTLFGEMGKITDGTITFEGQDIEVGSATDAISIGLSLVPEDRKGQGLVLGQTILENLSLPNLLQFFIVLPYRQNAELSASLKQAKICDQDPSLHVHAIPCQAEINKKLL